MITAFPQILTQHIPNLWMHSLSLCHDQDSAGNLLYGTLKQAAEDYKSKPDDDTPVYLWLVQLMYERFLKDKRQSLRRPVRRSYTRPSLNIRMTESYRDYPLSTMVH